MIDTRNYQVIECNSDYTTLSETNSSLMRTNTILIIAITLILAFVATYPFLKREETHK